MTSIVPSLAFTPEDLDRAFGEWGCNCGPTSLAVALGISLDAAHAAIPLFDERRYTNPTMMIAALRTLGACFEHNWSRRDGIAWPDFGLARIQWAGPWTGGGVPIAARYRHSHWVACATAPNGDGGIYDCNSAKWISLEDWKRVIVPAILKEFEPEATGEWWVTNAIEVKRRGDNCHMTPLRAIGAPVKYTADCAGCKYCLTYDLTTTRIMP